LTASAIFNISPQHHNMAAVCCHNMNTQFAEYLTFNH
jgi:hypothetical protein